MAPRKGDFDPAYNNSGDGVLKVPGFGLPLNHWPGSEKSLSYSTNGGEVDMRFRHGASDFKPDRLVVREIAMLNLVNAITEKKEWQEKVFNEDILTKWKIEALHNEPMSERAFDWCIRELQEKARSYLDDKLILVFDNASGVIKSDELINVELKTELKKVLRPLQSKANPDWHPNSNDQVMNLVHPSLFPLVFGKTRVLTSGLVKLDDLFDKVGEGEVADKPDIPFQENTYSYEPRYETFWSTSFQWLPAEVKFKADKGAEVEITSYINNLNPLLHGNIYPVVEKFIAASIEPWNQILITTWKGRKPPRIKTYGVEIENGDDPKWLDSIHHNDGDFVISDELWEDIRAHMRQPDRPGYDPTDDSYEIPDNWEELRGWDLYEVISNKTRRARTFLHPEPGISTTYEDWKAGSITPVVSRSRWYAVPKEKDKKSIEKHEFYDVCLQDEFRSRGLQVIVKLSSIELTPEKPSYGGGSWHIEGMLNEHIVATSIYYYDVENTTESSISFRQEAFLDDMELVYEQSDHDPLGTIFGCDSMYDEPAIQNLGSVSTPEGRLIAFPNTLQHRVSPFKLADPSKPGHRRFLVLWLVDPNLRVLSTANVPPQQHDWWAPQIKQSLGSKLPPELKDMTVSFADDWPMSLEAAKEHRLALMAERTTFTTTIERSVDSYNLCEH